MSTVYDKYRFAARLVAALSVSMISLAPAASQQKHTSDLQNDPIVVVGREPDDAISVTGRNTIPNDETRLKTVGYRLSVSSAAHCNAAYMLTGLVYHDLSYYDPSDQERMKQDYDLSYGFAIISVVKRSSAFYSGFKAGDQILRINGNDVRKLFPIEHNNKYKLYRTVALELYLSDSLLGGDLILTILRSGKSLELPIHGQPGCGGHVRMELDDDEGPNLDLNRNAWYDGENIGISRRLVEYTKSDDELAFVVAHEMAHNRLGHFFIKYKGLFGMPKPASARDKLRMEIQADTLAVQLLAKTVYDPKASVGFLQRSASENWMKQSDSHPNNLDRISIVKEATDEIEKSGISTPSLATK